MDEIRTYCELKRTATPDAVRHAVDSGRLARLRPGYYASQQSWFAYLAATLAAIPRAVASHQSAAALHGFDEQSTLLHITVPHQLAVVSRPGLAVHRSRQPHAFDWVGGLRVTDPVRTVLDLARCCPHPEGLVRAEAAIHRGVVTPDLLLRRIGDVRRLHGADRARGVIAAARVGAESPMETRLRVALTGAGLPEPVLQHHIRTASGTVRVDLAWPSALVCIEYDGFAWHSGADAFARDRRRWRAVVAAGWDVYPVTAVDIRTVAALAYDLRRALERRHPGAASTSLGPCVGLRDRS